MPDACQAIVADVPDADHPDRVCGHPRHGSYLVELGDVRAYVDLCTAHAALVELDWPRRED